MQRFSKLLNPMSYVRLVKKRLRGGDNPFSSTGHFYSPLLDIRNLGPNDTHLPFDGEECWEQLDLRPLEQKAYYQGLIDRFPVLPFPRTKTDEFRYYTDSGWFAFSDAFTLSGIIRKEAPRRIIEVGSGFSSAVMLDTLNHTKTSAALTFIEPHPARLYSVLTADDRSRAKILVQSVQDVAMSVFDQLEERDILFIDSSHVAKIGSDVTFLLLRILPRLKPGVIVHVHDIFYPFSYPIGWIRGGRSWNESLFLRAFLMGNPQYQVLAFNSFAGHTFPEIFRDRLPQFLKDTGGSIWLRKVA